MEVVDTQQAVGGMIISSLIALIVFFIARWAGYFRLPPSLKKTPVTFRQTLGVFLIYILLAYLILPLLTIGMIRLFNFQNLSREAMISIQIALLFLLFFCLSSYCFLIQSQSRDYIFWGSRKPNAKLTLKSILMGLVSWFVSYPFVFLVGMITSLISLAIWKEAKVEQVAVKQLKMTMGHPALFGIMIFLVVIIVPFMEELLFRGFLQSFLKNFLGRIGGIIVTGIIFAVVHFSPSQGTGNFQLICSLFVLALFLGFIYEREGSLWAPFSLHAFFNGFSVLLIIFSE